MKIKVLIPLLIAIGLLLAAIALFKNDRPIKPSSDANGKSQFENNTNLPLQILSPAPVMRNTSNIEPSSQRSVSKPEALARLKGSRNPPSSSLAAQFKSTDEPELLSTYRSTRNLAERTGLIWVLAMVGGEATAKTFIHTLTEEFSDKTLVEDEAGTSGAEESVMQTIAFCMGLLASRSQSAFEFVVQGTQPAFWQSKVKWNSSTGKEIYGLMASSAIQAIGIMDRQDVPDLLQKLKAHPPQDIPLPAHLRRTFEGGILDAAFYHSMLQEIGVAAFHQWLLDRPTDIIDADGAYRRWRLSPDGAEWTKWAKEQSAVEENK